MISAYILQRALPVSNCSPGFVEIMPLRLGPDIWDDFGTYHEADLYLHLVLALHDVVL